MRCNHISMHPSTKVCASAALLLGLFLGGVSASAPERAEPAPPERGKSVLSMGFPHQTRYFMSGEVGLKPIEDREFVGTLSLGFDRTLFNPMVQALAFSAEYFMGISGQAGGEAREGATPNQIAQDAPSRNEKITPKMPMTVPATE